MTLRVLQGDERRRRRFLEGAVHRPRQSLHPTNRRGIAAGNEEHPRSFGRSEARFDVSVGGPVANRGDVRRWEDAGVDRLIVSPWARSREAVEGLRRFSELVYG